MNDNIGNRFFIHSKELDKKIKLLGLDFNSELFLGLRISTSIILFILLFVFIKYGYIVAPIVTIIYYLLFEYLILDLNIKRRKRLLESDAIAYFRVFLIASKNNKNNKLNIKHTNTSLPSNRLSYELSKVVRDTDLGIDFVKSINEVEKMIPSNSINNILTMIASASKYGNKLSESINKELDYLADKYNHEVINRYKSIPFKYIIACLLFVMLFIIMLLIIK